MKRENFLIKLLVGISVVIISPLIIAETMKKKFIFQYFLDSEKSIFCWMDCDNLNVYCGLEKGEISEHIFTKEEWLKYKWSKRSNLDYEEIHVEYSKYETKYVRCFDGIYNGMEYGYGQWIKYKDINRCSSISELKKPEFPEMKYDIRFLRILES